MDLRTLVAKAQTPAGHYSSSSKAAAVPIAGMADAHLTNAIAKLRRGGSTVFNSPALVALDAERKRRGL